VLVGGVRCAASKYGTGESHTLIGFPKNAYTSFHVRGGDRRSPVARQILNILRKRLKYSTLPIHCYTLHKDSFSSPLASEVVLHKPLPKGIQCNEA